MNPLYGQTTSKSGLNLKNNVLIVCLQNCYFIFFWILQRVGASFETGLVLKVCIIFYGLYFTKRLYCIRICSVSKKWVIALCDNIN